MPFDDTNGPVFVGTVVCVVATVVVVVGVVVVVDVVVEVVVGMVGGCVVAGGEVVLAAVKINSS